jgi:hypothetical protein
MAPLKPNKIINSEVKTTCLVNEKIVAWPPDEEADWGSYNMLSSKDPSSSYQGSDNRNRELLVKEKIWETEHM